MIVVVMLLMVIALQWLWSSHHSGRSCRICLLNIGTSVHVDCRTGSTIIIMGFFGIGSSWQDEWRWQWLVIHIHLLGVSIGGNLPRQLICDTTWHPDPTKLGAPVAVASNGLQSGSQGLPVVWWVKAR
jgi:hypothetical protein